MLGRLHMTVDEALESFCLIMNVAFSDRKLIGSSAGEFKTSNLERAITNMVHRYTQDENSRMVDAQPSDTECKT
jgi:hypothetical protein